MPAPGVPYSKIGDTSTHMGAVTSASPFVFTEFPGNGIDRLGDSFICPLHGPQVIASGSDFVFETMIPLARSGDAISCGASITGPCSLVVFEG